MRTSYKYDFTEQLTSGPLSLDVFWLNNMVYGIKLDLSEEDDKVATHTAQGRLMQQGLERLVNGKPAEWPDLPLDFTGISEFSRKVINAMRGIEHGHFITYGDLAAEIGSPKAARAVGRAVGANPWPLYVP